MSRWPAYNDLAWIEPVIAPPEDYVEETTGFCQLLKEHGRIEVETLLHLGSGAGINDYTFKEHFQVTGVDISQGMLQVAREINPEITYVHGDMRSIRLDQLFDSVAIPDSIGYMQTREDLQKAIETAEAHLKPGGVLLITAHIQEEFQANNFVYTGSKGDLDIVLFENNYLPHPRASTYEATMVFLIRQRGKLEIYTDRHTIGLFKLETWLDLLKGSGFEVNTVKTDHLYEPYIAGDGEYPLINFVCVKPG